MVGPDRVWTASSQVANIFLPLLLCYWRLSARRDHVVVKLDYQGSRVLLFEETKFRPIENLPSDQVPVSYD